MINFCHCDLYRRADQRHVLCRESIFMPQHSGAKILVFQHCLSDRESRNCLRMGSAEDACGCPSCSSLKLNCASTSKPTADSESAVVFTSGYRWYAWLLTVSIVSNICSQRAIIVMSETLVCQIIGKRTIWPKYIQWRCSVQSMMSRQSQVVELHCFSHSITSEIRKASLLH